MSDIYAASINDVVKFRIWNGPFGIASKDPILFERLSDDCVTGRGIVIKTGMCEDHPQYLLRVLDFSGDLGIHQNGTDKDKVWVNEFEIVGILAGNLVHEEREGEYDESN
jgi:hypothetical protein